MTTESPATGDRTSRPLIARWFARSKPRAPEHRPHQSAVPDATRPATLGVLELCADSGHLADAGSPFTIASELRWVRASSCDYNPHVRSTLFLDRAASAHPTQSDPQGVTPTATRSRKRSKSWV